MQKRLFILFISVILFLIGTTSVQAGGVLPVPTTAASSNCDTVTGSWDNGLSGGAITNIVIFEAGSGISIMSQSFTGSSGSFNLDIPDLSDGTAIDVLFEVLNAPGGTVLAKTKLLSVACVAVSGSTAGVTSDPVIVEETSLCRDGRLTYTQCNPLVVYNVISEDGVGLIVYNSDPESNGLGEFILEISAETFTALPANSDANCTIASSADGTVVVYLLTTGEIQVNAGPDGVDNKVFVYIFSDLVTVPTIDTYTTLDALEILPSCLS